MPQWKIPRNKYWRLQTAIFTKFVFTLQIKNRYEKVIILWSDIKMLWYSEDQFFCGGFEKNGISFSNSDTWKPQRIQCQSLLYASSPISSPEHVSLSCGTLILLFSYYVTVSATYSVAHHFMHLAAIGK